MKTVIQRVRRAAVTVEGETVGAIDQGLLILLGIGPNDTEAEAKWLADKIAVMRIFADEQDKFNRSLLDVGGGALVVSQFTLYADAVGGRRPSFIKAAPPQLAEPLVDRFAAFLNAAGVSRVETGRFGARMLVEIHNDGPVTILLDREPQ
ncbi:MAG: D-tyrosyl-tRNA(Tyr) deacylase [Anaerolineae bacterium]|nr:D-tyrosyl-tRNA(Tyr) deacylase [Anaerolineae bacterium]